MYDGIFNHTSSNPFIIINDPSSLNKRSGSGEGCCLFTRQCAYLLFEGLKRQNQFDGHPPANDPAETGLTGTPKWDNEADKNKAICCLARYAETCQNPQMGPQIHVESPPRCSNHL